MEDKSPKLVCVSGGFDPVHPGHVVLFEEAANYGRLVVILNSDDWLMRKKGFCFLNWEQRAFIIRALRVVDEVVTVDDSDETVCEALFRLRPDYFANGGDQKLENTPEIELCNKLGIKTLWNIGGEKIESSSNLVKRIKVKDST
jgi:D-beta-D-heptose 7-phosphate kinase/D-beta-D-heptose 1-phosphate adenosyltransferase